MNVFCYIRNLDFCCKEFYMSYLSCEEKTRAFSYRQELLQNRFIVGRGMLREVLGGILSVSPIEIPILYTKQGKPYTEGLYFNASHSYEQFVICVCKEEEIGVDIEKIDYHGWNIEWEKELFSMKEQKHANSLSGSKRSEYFFSVWTRKEAFLKYQGSGLSSPLPNIDTEESLSIFYELNAPENYTACLASRRSDIIIQYPAT